MEKQPPNTPTQTYHANRVHVYNYSSPQPQQHSLPHLPSSVPSTLTAPFISSAPHQNMTSSALHSNTSAAPPTKDTIAPPASVTDAAVESTQPDASLKSESTQMSITEKNNAIGTTITLPPEILFELASKHPEALISILQAGKNVFVKNPEIDESRTTKSSNLSTAKDDDFKSSKETVANPSTQILYETGYTSKGNLSGITEPRRMAAISMDGELGTCPLSESDPTQKSGTPPNEIKKKCLIVEQPERYGIFRKSTRRKIMVVLDGLAYYNKGPEVNKWHVGDEILFTCKECGARIYVKAPEKVQIEGRAVIVGYERHNKEECTEYMQEGE